MSEKCVYPKIKYRLRFIQEIALINSRLGINIQTARCDEPVLPHIEAGVDWDSLIEWPMRYFSRIWLRIGRIAWWMPETSASRQCPEVVKLALPYCIDRAGLSLGASEVGLWTGYVISDARCYVTENLQVGSAARRRECRGSHPHPLVTNMKITLTSTTVSYKKLRAF